jgi:hypothetical protein
MSIAASFITYKEQYPGILGARSFDGAFVIGDIGSPEL